MATTSNAAATAHNGSVATVQTSRPDSVFHANDEQDDDDEWEYEYHDTEYEDFYVTLDLADVIAGAGPRVAPPTKSNRRRSQRDTHDEDPTHTTADNQQRSEEDRSEDDEEDNVPQDTIQIMELHSDNPVVAYAGKVYSCKWGSSLGTDMYFANVVDSFEMDIEPLRAGTAFDLVGMSAAKLIAANAELKPRGTEESIPDDRLAPEHTSGRPLFNLSSGFSISGPQQSQIRFLERLNHVKARRQETDKIPIGIYRPSKAFQEKYATTYAPTGEDSDEETFLRSGNTKTPVADGVRAKPGVRQRAKRGDQSLHGDITKIRRLFEDELRKPTPMTKPKFPGSGMQLTPVIAGSSRVPRVDVLETTGSRRPATDSIDDDDEGSILSESDHIHTESSDEGSEKADDEDADEDNFDDIDEMAAVAEEDAPAHRPSASDDDISMSDTHD